MHTGMVRVLMPSRVSLTCMHRALMWFLAIKPHPHACITNHTSRARALSLSTLTHKTDMFTHTHTSANDTLACAVRIALTIYFV